LPRLADTSGQVNVARPNILWISTEDLSPDLGCYGDAYAVTPNIDKLAAQGVRYTSVFTHAGVCAPSRSGIITGMYPTTIGTHHMRCEAVPPSYVKCFSEYLRAAGYYCTNNVKTDYQFDPPMTAWDECSNKAHWRNRAPGQPFFAVFNFTTSHESQIRNRTKQMQDRRAALNSDEKHDPAKAKLPPYYPDTPVVRRDWAQYYDVVTLTDKEVGDILNQLESDGLADDTIVWFWGDHGRGLPRAKRWIYDSGIHVPLIIRIPAKQRKFAGPDKPNTLKPGTVNDDLIAFVDFAPTMLSLVGVKIPQHIQGRAFLGSQKAEPRQYVFAARDRMDEAYDVIRAVRDKRYKYIRNFAWHVTRGQDIEYMNEMPTMQEMRRLHAAGKLDGPQMQYFEPTKPVEELYDTKTDPHEIKNLAGDPKYQDILERMRCDLAAWMKQTGDIGLIPEAEFDEMKRPGGRWQKTAEPVFFEGDNAGQGGVTVTMFCPTEGASIAYKLDGGTDKKDGWQLYTAPPVLKPGQVLSAKACRIGYRDSNEVRFKIGDRPTTPEQPSEQSETPHWREQIDKTDILDRLLKMKDLDFLGDKAISRYAEALGDEYASVRYWAVVVLHNASKTHERTEPIEPALEKMLKDPSPVVRVAAAQALAYWDRQDRVLPVLAEVLQCKVDKARLYAITALKQLGEKARPALPQIQAALNDSDDYVKRLARAVTRQLEK
jgi:uncharacterized sulfatase